LNPEHHLEPKEPNAEMIVIELKALGAQFSKTAFGEAFSGWIVNKNFFYLKLKGKFSIDIYSNFSSPRHPSTSLT
jgi:hypothetical protein